MKLWKIWNFGKRENLEKYETKVDMKLQKI
jgi:hypothetical protein